MVIEELLPVGALTLVSGQPYSGKTFFALEAARAVATGQPFMGKWKVERPGNVLIVEQDSPKYDTGRALWAMLSDRADSDEVDAISIAWHPGLDLASRLDAMRIIATARSLHTYRGVTINKTLNVDKEGNITELMEEYDHGYAGASLIILDSARSLHRGKEDKSDDMEQVMQNIKLIREHTGAAIILIAHDNASGEKTRGSTAIPAGVDSEYAITKRKSARDHGVFVRKARAIAPKEFRYVIDTGIDDKEQVTKRVMFKEFMEQDEPAPEPEDDTRGVLMRYIAEAPRTLSGDLAQWAEVNGVAPRTMKKYLADGVETGYLVVTYATEGRKRFATYSVRASA